MFLHIMEKNTTKTSMGEEEHGEDENRYCSRGTPSIIAYRTASIE